jgi:hypothetical protein
MEILWKLLRFIFEHNELFIAISIVLFLMVTMFFIVRTVSSENDQQASGQPINVDAIEGVMRKVLNSSGAGRESDSTSGFANSAAGIAVGLTAAGAASAAAGMISKSSQGGSSAGGASADGSGAFAIPTIAAVKEIAELKSNLEEKEKHITMLMDSLSLAQANGGGGSGSASGESGQSQARGSIQPADAELMQQLEELQARLTEYEIIEDDIADLTQFKEENKRLKEMLATMQAGGASTQSAAQPVAQSAAPQQAVPVVLQEPKSLVAVENEIPLKFEAADKFGIDPADLTMQEFAAAVDMKRAFPPEVDKIIPVETPAAVAVNDITQEDLEGNDAQAAIDAILRQAEQEQSQPESAPVAALSSQSLDIKAASDDLDPEKLLAEMKTSEASPQDAIDDLFAEFRDTNKT